MTASVQVVFCMDTEGPCNDPGDPALLATWDAVDRAMDTLFDPAFRSLMPDPAGGRLRIGWFFLTWTGFTANPRNRAVGYHVVRDHYLARWGDQLRDYGDEQCWHYHHPPPSGVGNEWGLDWAIGDEHDRILSRQLLERRWFPSCFRAGGTILDPVSSRWVDAWFPIDYSNRAPFAAPGLVDWSGGVAEWRPYHPDPEDFRRPGAGRRLLVRCLDLETGIHVLSKGDVEEAFAQAERGRPAVLAVFDHDYRDIAERVNAFRELVVSAASRHPSVPWGYCAPVEAVRAALGAPRQPGVVIEAWPSGDGVAIWSTAALFQAIPWIAVRTDDGEITHVEDGILRLDERHWRWDPPEGLRWVEAAIGGSTPLGESAAAVVRPDDAPAASFLADPNQADPTRPWSIWEYSTRYTRSCLARSSGSGPELDSAAQARELLATTLSPGASVLDVGCGAGHLARSLVPLGFEYHGIDAYARAIEIGRTGLADLPLPRGRLRAMPLEELPRDERYDAVVCLSTLLYFPDARLPLEIMAGAARRLLIVRSSFGDAEIRYLEDTLLEPFAPLYAYFSIFDRKETERFLVSRGLVVQWVHDTRERERFGGQAEIVGGIPLPYEFLVAERR